MCHPCEELLSPFAPTPIRLTSSHGPGHYAAPPMLHSSPIPSSSLISYFYCTVRFSIHITAMHSPWRGSVWACSKPLPASYIISDCQDDPSAPHLEKVIAHDDRGGGVSRLQFSLFSISSSSTSTFKPGGTKAVDKSQLQRRIEVGACSLVPGGGGGVCDPHLWAATMQAKWPEKTP